MRRTIGPSSSRTFLAACGGPFLRETDERLDLRLDQVRGEPHQRPAFAEAPALLVDIGQPPRAELLHRPLACLLDPGRAGEPRAVDIAQPRDVIHHLRAIEPFIADAAEQREVELLALRQQGRRRGQQRRRQNYAFHPAIINERDAG